MAPRYVCSAREESPVDRSSQTREKWESGEAYESYMGRWSRLVAGHFLDWLGAPENANWLDVGCGTGVLSSTVAARSIPKLVVGTDSSQDYVRYARQARREEALHFVAGNALALPFRSEVFDTIVSGLALNFIPRPEGALSEMVRVTRARSTVAAYVWDYSGEMQLIRHFWNAAADLAPGTVELDEGNRFAICSPKPLTALFEAAGLTQIEVRSIVVPTDFRDFDDYWLPFLGGQGTAPGYAATLAEGPLIELRERLRATLPTEPDGAIHMIARAWAVKGRKT